MGYTVSYSRFGHWQTKLLTRCYYVRTLQSKDLSNYQLLHESFGPDGGLLQGSSQLHSRLAQLNILTAWDKKVGSLDSQIHLTTSTWLSLTGWFTNLVVELGKAFLFSALEHSHNRCQLGRPERVLDTFKVQVALDAEGG